jgi:hypothetical protein
VSDLARQWDLEDTVSQRDEEFLQRRAELRARYYSVKCSTHTDGRAQLLATTPGRPPETPADSESPPPQRPTTTWKRIRDAIGVVKGRPADAIEDTERLYDD